MHASRQTARALQSWNRSANNLQELLLRMAQQLVDVPALVTVSATDARLQTLVGPGWPSARGR